MRKQIAKEIPSERPRLLARLHADELEIVSGGGCTVVATDGPPRDITNVGGDNDGCDY